MIEILRTGDAYIVNRNGHKQGTFVRRTFYEVLDTVPQQSSGPIFDDIYQAMRYSLSTGGYIVDRRIIQPFEAYTFIPESKYESQPIPSPSSQAAS
jgi:hypothetical protein